MIATHNQSSPFTQTHNIALAGPIAEYVVAVSQDGCVSGQDSVASALEHDSKLAAEVAKEEEVATKADEAAPAINETAEKANGKLIVEEEVEIGRVGWPASEHSPFLVATRLLISRK